MQTGTEVSQELVGAASARLAQQPLPALAGLEFIAKDVAADDGSLSSFRRNFAGVTVTVHFSIRRMTEASSNPMFVWIKCTVTVIA